MSEWNHHAMLDIAYLPNDRVQAMAYRCTEALLVQESSEDCRQQCLVKRLGLGYLHLVHWELPFWNYTLATTFDGFTCRYTYRK